MSIASAVVRKTKNVSGKFKPRYCAVCDRRAPRFLPYGNPRRPDAMCPWCRSLERHRLTVSLLRENTDLFDGRPKRILHIAPEKGIIPILRQASGDGYLSGDLFNPKAMERIDITDIKHPDETFDVVYCSHVLEHVPDDRKAISELHRVMKPGGWGLIDAPITADVTVEDLSIEDPQERLRLYGQVDHVRRYGPDYVDRLIAAGFTVSEYTPESIFDPDQIERQSLRGAIHLCNK